MISCFFFVASIPRMNRSLKSHDRRVDFRFVWVSVDGKRGGRGAFLLKVQAGCRVICLQ